MSIYPVIPITQFYNNAVTYDPRAAKVELGKGGVLDRSRIHFFNNTRKNYSISAVLKDKDTLQNFLELNRGKPFEFRYDGSNSAGLYICKTWSWDWVVYVDGVSGVWNFSATFEQVFRPGWVSDTTGLGTLTLGAITVTGTGLISINPSGSGSLIVPIFTANGSGEVIQSNQGSGALSWPVIQVSGSGSLTDNGSGAITWPTVTMSGVGTVSIMPEGEGNLDVPIFSVDGSGNISITYSGDGGIETTPITVEGEGVIYFTHTGSGTLITSDITSSGNGSMTMPGSGDLETSGIVISGSGAAEGNDDPEWANVNLLLRFEGVNNSTTFTDSSSFSRTVNVVSTTPVITTTNPLRGTSSGLFSGSGGNLSIPDFGLRSESFTIEAFIRLNNVTGNKVIYTNYGNSLATQNGAFILFVLGDKLSASRSGISFLNSTTSLVANTPYYVAFTYNHSTGIWAIYIDGNLENSGTNGGLITSSAFANQIGGGLSSSNINSWRFAGRIDDVRVTRGVVRAISGIPSDPYPTS